MDLLEVFITAYFITLICAVVSIRIGMKYIKAEKELIKRLKFSSEYTFYDDEHGFSIGVSDIYDVIGEAEGKYKF